MWLYLKNKKDGTELTTTIVNKYCFIHFRCSGDTYHTLWNVFCPGIDKVMEVFNRFYLKHGRWNFF